MFAATALATLLAGLPCDAAASKPVVRVDARGGNIGVEARGATLAQVLQEVANQADFELVMDDAIARPPVDVTVSPAPVEYVVREILHGRNYALVYDADRRSLSQVIVLDPSTPGKPTPVGPKARSTAAKSPQGPTVIRR